MKNRSPIYNLLHQEIKACADHLLDISQNSEFSIEKDVEHVLARLAELLTFASKVRPDEHYTPLSELKEYLENVMLKYQDDQNGHLTMRLSEAISILGTSNERDIPFKSSVISSLTNHFVCYFQEEIKPGRPLFRKLIEIKKIHTQTI